jgi:hypothetical protein
VRSSATTLDDYLASLPDDRSSALRAVRKTILSNLPKGYEEVFEDGFLTYQVPLSVYPDTYNKKPLMFAALASQKGNMALYMCNVYSDETLRARLEAGFAKAGKRLDMGKSCLRFKKVEDLPLDVIGKIIAASPMKGYVARAKAVHSPEAKAERAAARRKAAER